MPTQPPLGICRSALALVCKYFGRHNDRRTRRAVNKDQRDDEEEWQLLSYPPICWDKDERSGKLPRFTVLVECWEELCKDNGETKPGRREPAATKIESSLPTQSRRTPKKDGQERTLSKGRRLNATPRWVIRGEHSQDRRSTQSEIQLMPLESRGSNTPILKRKASPSPGLPPRPRTLQAVVRVIDAQGKWLIPTTSARANALLRTGRAALALYRPFTIRLLSEKKEAVRSEIGCLRHSSRRTRDSSRRMSG